MRRLKRASVFSQASCHRYALFVLHWIPTWIYSANFSLLSYFFLARFCLLSWAFRSAVVLEHCFISYQFIIFGFCAGYDPSNLSTQWMVMTLNLFQSLLAWSLSSQIANLRKVKEGQVVLHSVLQSFASPRKSMYIWSAVYTRMIAHLSFESHKLSLIDRHPNELKQD